MYYINNGFVSIIETNAGYWMPNTKRCEVFIKPELFAESFDVIAEADKSQGSPKYHAKTYH